MLISELGGEFALLKRLTQGQSLPAGVIKGIGDDCAVLAYNDTVCQLVTTDMMVEGDHFSLKWHTPFQVGHKLMESNVSDIVCKGGKPAYAFLSMSLKRDTTVEFMDDFYSGLYASAARHAVYLLGGDTTHGTKFVFNLTLIGFAEKPMVRLRSAALAGDAICVTGKLGGSTAGLKLLLKGKEGFLTNHLEPRSRTAAEGYAIARYSHAMIDVSDGLASEVTHIALESGLGAGIDYAAIPMSVETRATAARLLEDPCDFALYGGEDYEIVFTLPPSAIPALQKEFSDFTVVGKMLDKKEGISLLKEGVRTPLKKGYDHFA